MARNILLVVLALSAAALFAAQPKSKEVLKRVDSLLNTYAAEHPLKQYPSTLREFQEYAAKKGKPLDLSVFSKFEFERHGVSFSITYTCKDTGETAAIVCRTIKSD